MKRAVFRPLLAALLAGALLLFTACSGKDPDPAPSFDENLEGMVRYALTLPNPSVEKMLADMENALGGEADIESSSDASWEDPIREEMAKYWAADKMDQAMHFWYVNGAICAGTGYSSRAEGFAITSENEDLQREFSVTVVLLDPAGAEAGRYTVTGRARESAAEPGMIEYFSLLPDGERALMAIREVCDPTLSPTPPSK